MHMLEPTRLHGNEGCWHFRVLVDFAGLAGDAGLGPSMHVLVAFTPRWAMLWSCSATAWQQIGGTRGRGVPVDISQITVRGSSGSPTRWNCSFLVWAFTKRIRSLSLSCSLAIDGRWVAASDTCRLAARMTTSVTEHGEEGGWRQLRATAMGLAFPATC